MFIRSDAPAKPRLSDPCNGCGVCCLAECCPLAIVLYRRRQGPCPQLVWLDARKRYGCGLAYPPRWEQSGWLVRLKLALYRRWIGAGIGCDCDYDVEPDHSPKAQ